MTSPLSSLNKGKKSHLVPKFGQRQMPFRAPDYSPSERMLLDDITGRVSPRSSVSDESISMTPRRILLGPLNGSPREMYNTLHNGHNKISPLGHMMGHSNKGAQLGTSAPSDMDLMSSMMQKIAMLEKKNLNYAREIIEKDKKIKVLQEKNALLKKSINPVDGDNPSRISQLETKCLELKQQIYEMESFLADYGMIWVGDKSNIGSNKYLDEEEEEEVVRNTSNSTWKPDASFAAGDFIPDFDAIIENVKDLNVIAGDGVSKITKTFDGAKLQVAEPINLNIYKNGIIMFNGPFRPYTDATTQRCIKDFMDGYFPSELQSRYPEGIPFKVTDRRFVIFHDPRLTEEFPGVGHLLGGEEQPSKLVDSRLSQRSSEMSPEYSVITNSNVSSISTNDDSSPITSTLPGSKLSVEQYVNKLPSSVIRSGKVIDVRSAIADRLSGSSISSSSAELVETKTVLEMQQRMKLPEDERPPSARDVTTIRVKTEDGSKTLLLKMKFKDTISDIRKYIDQKRPNHKAPYDIVSNFPSQTYTNDSETLLEYGLVPNANICLRSRKNPTPTKN